MWSSALTPSWETGPLSETAPSNPDTVARSLSISARAFSGSVTLSMVLAESWIDLLRSGTLRWNASSCCENSSTGETGLPELELLASSALALAAEKVKAAANKAATAKRARSLWISAGSNTFMTCLPSTSASQKC